MIARSRVPEADARACRRLSGELRRPLAAPEEQALLVAFVAAAQTGDLATLEHLLTADVAAGGGEVVRLVRPMTQESLDRVAA